LRGALGPPRAFLFHRHPEHAGYCTLVAVTRIVQYTQLLRGRIAQDHRCAAAAIEIQRLSPDQRLGDALFTGLRLSAGVDLGAIGRRYGVDVWARFGAELEPFIQNGCLRQDGARLWLTRRGMLLANEVMAVFV